MARTNGSNFDPANYLREAAQLFKGKLGDSTQALDDARTAKNGVLWDILVLMICHAGTNVFPAGKYTRATAKVFKDDVTQQLGISEKQAGKWTESISAALGVRGLRKGVKPMDGLMAVAMTGPADVRTYLSAKEITTFNQFMGATRAEKDPVGELAKKVHGLSTQQRERLALRVKRLDLAESDAEEEDDDNDDDKSAHARVP